MSASTTAHEPVDDGATLAFGEEEDSDDEPAHEPVDDGAIFFKQKTAYEMESRDWSSDVCSSD
eukprot:COSAG05_NODE_14099_length_408_cov_0.702265_1_plen_62_part_10